MSEKIGPKEVCWDFITRKIKALPEEEKSVGGVWEKLH